MISIKRNFTFTDIVLSYMKLEEKIPWVLYLLSICFIFFGVYLSQAEIILTLTGWVYYIFKLISLVLVGVGFLLFVLTATRAR